MPRLLSKEHFSTYSLKAVFSDPEELLPFLSGMHYSAGEIMFCNFYEEYKLYLFTEGRFNVFAYQSDGSHLFIRSCEAVTMAGDVELVRHLWPDLTVPAQKDFYFEMLTDCTMIVLNYKFLLDRLQKDSRLLNVICHSLVEKFTFFGDSEIQKNLSSAEARVSDFLLTSANADGAWTGNQKLVAEQLRISYRHLHRFFKAFIEAGCIVRIAGGYRIADREKLNAYLS